ncbi:MAG: alanine racemase [Oscillospiraceae bacterium]|nr:alanine racemase [Oscillospiraceae bacterium]
MNKRAWAEIDLDAVAYNIREIRKITSPSAKIMGVVKADGYGHGFMEVTKTILNNGADYLAVATLEEAVQLRKRKFDVPILILGATEDASADDIVEFDVMPTVFTYSFAKALSESAVKKGKKAKIHIKIDTGMSRIGYLCREESIDEIIKISMLDNLEIEGIFSHLACSDEIDREYTERQFERFTGICERLEKRGLKIPVKHICNSAGVMMYPQMHMDMVRPGVIIYGLYPSDDVDKTKLALKPAMTLKAKVTMVKEVESGVGVSYGKTYITDKKTKIATVPIGYADGYMRLLSGKAQMLCGGERVNVIGRICMDQCMIDVTNVNNINIGDEVTVFGADTITADTVAGWLGAINYEIVCMIGRRIPRIYIRNGEVVRKLAYLL